MVKNLKLARIAAIVSVAVVAVGFACGEHVGPEGPDCTGYFGLAIVFLGFIVAEVSGAMTAGFGNVVILFVSLIQWFLICWFGLWLAFRRSKPNPQGRGNGRQPFDSEKRRASATAASRRSP